MAASRARRDPGGEDTTTHAVTRRCEPSDDAAAKAAASAPSSSSRLPQDLVQGPSQPPLGSTRSIAATPNSNTVHRSRPAARSA